MTGIFHKGLVVFLSLALSFSVTTWFRTRHELRTLTVANNFLRKTLGDLAVAIAEKDKEIDRLTQSNCGGGKKSPAGSSR